MCKKPYAFECEKNSAVYQQLYRRYEHASSEYRQLTHNGESIVYYRWARREEKPLESRFMQSVHKRFGSAGVAVHSVVRFRVPGVMLKREAGSLRRQVEKLYKSFMPSIFMAMGSARGIEAVL